MTQGPGRAVMGTEVELGAVVGRRAGGRAQAVAGDLDARCGALVPGLAPRPWLQPAAQNAAPRIRARIEDAVREAIRQAARR